LPTLINESTIDSYLTYFLDIQKEGDGMLTAKIEVSELKEMILSSVSSVSSKKEIIDRLNVFPVPDGDTGRNLSLTLSVIGDKLEEKSYQSMDELANDLEESALMGATGNVGMLLAQFFGGFCSVIRGNGGVTPELLVKGMMEGSRSAYHAFTDPKEGTALTVLREMASGASESLEENKNPVEVLKDAWLNGKQALRKTRDMLPELRRAGVVDAGGLGVLCMVEGWLKALGEQPDQEDFSQAKPAYPKSSINFRYCTECLLKSRADSNGIKEAMRGKGDCLLVAGEKGFVKVHLHTNDPSDVITTCKQWGKLKKVKIDDMKKMHQELLFKDDLNGQDFC